MECSPSRRLATEPCDPDRDLPFTRPLLSIVFIDLVGGSDATRRSPAKQVGTTAGDLTNGSCKDIQGFGIVAHPLVWTCPVSVDSFLSSLLGDLCLYLPPLGILQRRAVWRRRRQKCRVLSWRSRVPVSPFVIDRRSITNG